MSKSVLTLIAPPDKEKLDEALLEEACAAITQAGGKVLARDWLAMAEAADIVFTRMEPPDAGSAVAGVLGGRQIDCIAQGVEGRQKRMLISDMDSTIITIECIDEIADFAGIKPQVAAITERAMRGEIAFPQALAERVGLLKGLDEAALARVYEERLLFMPGARELVATMRANHAYCVLVSGGFDFFTSRVRKALGFDADSANRLEVENGRLTGRVIPPILDKDAKLRMLMQVCGERGFGTEDVLAAGDGANDLPMLLAAGLGIAYHAKPMVQTSARARINYCDLTALLYAQGYRKEEFRDSSDP